jgi:ABC-2 type transport system permease protein
MKKITGINTVGLFTLVRREIDRILRISIQTFAAPLISATMFIFIFGYILGSRIDEIQGVPYMQFVFPGILLMNILSSAFEHTASAVYFGRWIRSIEEMLVAPFSYIEMILGYVLSAVTRSLLVGSGILIIGLLFGAVQISNVFLFIIYAISIATIFALTGILVGLWAKSFEQLGLLNVFVIMPLSFLGGMFYSLEFLSETVRAITVANPIFYFIDGMRYATVGYSESNLLLGASLIIGLITILSGLVIYLFKIGWRIRE